MDITYDYYRIFYYVARYGSFSKAAEVLLKGQPNITKAIANLESQLGCKLFIRSNKGVTLTAEGEKLYHHAEIAFANLSKAENEIVAGRNLDGGILSVAATEIGLYGALLAPLTQFRREHPSVKIRLTNYNSPQSLAAVKNGVADFAVVTLHEKTDDHFRITKIRDFEEILCCKKGYQYDADNIFQGSLISINRRSYTYRFYQQYFLSHGIHKEPDIEVATADQVIPLIKSGMGIGFVAEFSAKEALAKGEIEKIPLKNPPAMRSIYLVEDKSRNVSLAARELKKYLYIEK